jgi:serine/threonine protein kinase
MKKLHSAEQLAEFKREADILRNLKHPNIVSFFGEYFNQNMDHSLL